jgi:hypothetical protein
MKKHDAAVLAVGAALVALAMPLFAQHAEFMKINVPFNFIVENQRMPAGQYTVQPKQNGALLIRSVDGKFVSTVLSLPAALATTATESQVVFYRYGDYYFLAQLWMQGQNTGREVLKGRAESELSRKGIPRTLASLAAH